MMLADPCCALIFRKLETEFKVVPDAVIVVAPAPIWMMVQLKPTANDAGTVSVFAVATFIVMTVPLSPATKL